MFRRPENRDECRRSGNESEQLADTGDLIGRPVQRVVEGETGEAGVKVGPKLIRRLFTVLRIDLVYMYAIVFAMTVKPTTDDGWTILIAAAVLVTLTAIFLAPLRGGAAPELPAAATD